MRAVTQDMRAGIIGASSESIYAIEQAKKRGIYTIAVDGRDDAPGLRYADRSAVVDLNDLDALFAFFDSEPIDFILPVPVGRILTATGAVNERYGLPGVNNKATQLATDKWAFHEILSSQGLRNAEAILISKGGTTSGVKDMRFPIILKPRFGSGSRAVKMYRTYEEFVQDVADIISDEEDFIAETCKGGIEYGADVFVVNGRKHLILLREKMLTPEPYRQCVGYFAIAKTEETETLFRETEHVLDGAIGMLGIDNCLLHADIMFDGSEAFIIELSPRPSGHYLHNYFTRYATGFDMFNGYIDFAVAKTEGREFEFDYEYRAESMLIKYFDLEEGIVQEVPSRESVEARDDIICFNCNLRKGDVIGLVTNGASVMGRGYYVVKAGTLDEAKAKCKEIERLIIIKGEEND